MQWSPRYTAVWDTSDCPSARGLYLNTIYVDDDIQPVLLLIVSEEHIPTAH